MEKPFRLNGFSPAKWFIHTRKNHLAGEKLFSLNGFSIFPLILNYSSIFI